MLRNILQVSSVNYEYLPYTSATRIVQSLEGDCNVYTLFTVNVPMIRIV